MRILSIGNSFSEDAQRYLHRAARAQGLYIETVNLYIGGCPLEVHHRNLLSGAENYDLQFNGQNTGFHISIEKALLSGHWDVITLQQVSSQSPYYDKYVPYINVIADFVRKCCPKAKILIHQTWNYEEGSHRLCEELKYEKAADMLRDIVASYKKAAEKIGADGIIPSGEMLYKLHENGIEKVHRDTFHASLGAGRYAIALLWIRMLTGVGVTGNRFSDFDELVSDEEKEIVWKVVDSFEPIKFQ